MKTVFVYGSLKEGYWNHPILQGSELLTKAVTIAKYMLTDCGFPYLIPEDALGGAGRGSTAPVEGEVYLVTCEDVMDSLDALEGVQSGHYNHHDTVVVDDEGNEWKVTAYVAGDADYAQRFPICNKNEKGNYVWRE